MHRFLTLTFVVIVLMLAIACSEPSEPSEPSESSRPPELDSTAQVSTPAGVSTGVSTSASTGAPSTPIALPEAIAQRLKTAVAQQLGLNPEQIQLKTVSLAEWGDACLGLPQPDELCAQVITSGYEVVISTPERDRQVHSDRAGSTIRLAN